MKKFQFLYLKIKCRWMGCLRLRLLFSSERQTPPPADRGSNDQRPFLRLMHGRRMRWMKARPADCFRPSSRRRRRRRRPSVQKNGSTDPGPARDWRMRGMSFFFIVLLFSRLWSGCFAHLADRRMNVKKKVQKLGDGLLPLGSENRRLSQTTAAAATTTRMRITQERKGTTTISEGRVLASIWLGLRQSHGRVVCVRRRPNIAVQAADVGHGQGDVNLQRPKTPTLAV